jgi:hypothetical protein
MPDDQLVNALQSLTTQISQLNQFYTEQRVSPNVGTYDSASAVQMAIQTNGFSTNVADAAASIRQARQSMPTSIPSLGNEKNIAVSDPATVAKNIDDDRDNLGQVIAAAQIGEGGPQFYRRWRLGSYNLQQNLNMASNVGQNMTDATSPGMIGNLSRGFGQGFTNQFIDYTNQDKTSDNYGQMVYDAHNNLVAQGIKFGDRTLTPGLAQGASQILSSVGKGVGHIDDWLGTQATIGQTFGYGPGAGGNAILGHQLFTRDISQAQGIGMGALALQNYLTGRDLVNFGTGQGLTSNQAQSMLDVILNQGFAPNVAPTPWSTPGGDATTIAKNFMGPLISKMPGLSAETLGQFDPALRNGGTSASQLADALSNMDVQARAAKESVNTFGSSVADSAQALANMGSGLAQSIGTVTGFTEATGLDPHVAAQLAQSPIVQGLALGQGVLPSGLGSMGGGQFTSTTLQAVRMLNQGLKSINYDTYSRKDGTSLRTRNGSEMEAAQIASMLGISKSVVQRMLGEDTRYSHVAAAEEVLGSSTNGIGMWDAFQVARKAGHGQVTGANRETLNRDWNAQVIPALREAGISAKHIRELSNDKNWKDRLNQTDRYLSGIGGGGKDNKINATNVTVGLTPQAARILQIVQGPSQSKRESNAGRTPINIKKNQVGGDQSDVIHRKAWAGLNDHPTGSTQPYHPATQSYAY